MPDPFDFSTPTSRPLFGNDRGPGDLFGPNRRPPIAVPAQPQVPQLTEELVNSFMEEAGLADWEKAALEARAKLPTARSTEEAETLYKQAYESGPKIETFDDWNKHLAFREERNKKIRASIEKRAASNLISPEERLLLDEWLSEEAADVTSRRAEYDEAMRKAQEKAAEFQALQAPPKGDSFADQSKDDTSFWQDIKDFFSAQVEVGEDIQDSNFTWNGLSTAFSNYVRKTGLETGADWLLSVLATPVNTVSAVGFSVSTLASMGLDQLTMWASDPDSEAYKNALTSYANSEAQATDAWERGGGFMGIMAEWIPFWDDENSTIDLMASNFRNNVGESYDRLYVNIDHHTNGSLTDMNRAGERAQEWTFGIPNPLSGLLRAPSFPKNVAKALVGIQSQLGGYEYSAKELSEMEHEMTKEIAGGLLEMAYDPLNVVGGSATHGAVTKASYLKHLSKVTDNGIALIARAKALGMLDGEFAKAGRYIADADEAFELSQILSKDGNEFGQFGKFSDTVREKILFGEEDIQSVLARMEKRYAAADIPEIEKAGAAGQAAKGRKRYFEVAGQFYEDFNAAREAASKAPTNIEGVSGATIRYADLTRYEWAALQRHRAGTLTGTGKKFQKVVELAERAQSKFKAGTFDPSEYKIFTATAKPVTQESAARAGGLLDMMIKRELDNAARMTPREFMDNLKALRAQVANTKTLSKEVQKQFLTTIDEQLRAGATLAERTNAPGAMLHFQDMAGMIRSGKSNLFNAAEMLEKKLPLMAKLNLKQKARWTLEVAAKLGDKAVNSKLPTVVRKMVVSNVPPKWWRAKMVAEALATSDKVGARRFARQFNEAVTKRLAKYKFAPEYVEKERVIAAAGEPMIGANVRGYPLDAQGNVIPGQAPGPDLGLVQLPKAKLKKDVVEVLNTPVGTRHLTDAEKEDVLLTVRQIIERTEKGSRENPHKFLRELESTKMGRALIEQMGPHFDLALDISRMWDEGAEFLRLYQERKGLRVAELVDDVVEGWFGRVWSEDMMSLILENPAIRQFVKNMNKRMGRRLGEGVALSKQGQFAERSAKGMYAEQLEAALRKRFNLPKNMKIFSTGPGEVINANVRLAEQQFEKLRMAQAFIDASAPMPREKVQVMLETIRQREQANFDKFITEKKEIDGLSTEEAAMRRRLKIAEEIAKGKLVRNENADTPVGWTQKQLQNALRDSMGGKKKGLASNLHAEAKKFISRHIMPQINDAIAGKSVKDWGRAKHIVNTLHDRGINVERLLAASGKDSKAATEMLATLIREEWEKAVRAGEFEAIYDLGRIDPRIAEFLNDEKVMAHLTAVPLDTPEGRLMNIWVSGAERTLYDPHVGDAIANADINMAAPGVDIRKRDVLVGRSEVNPADPERMRNAGRRGFIMLTKEEGEAAFTAAHEIGHQVDMVGAVPPHLRSLFYEDYIKLMSIVKTEGLVRLPAEYRNMQKLVYEKIFGKSYTHEAATHPLFGGVHPVLEGYMRTLFTKDQWEVVKRLQIRDAANKPLSQHYRLAPNEAFADTFALAMQGIYDPRFPEFSKALMQTRERAIAYNSDIWTLFREAVGEAEAPRAFTLSKDPADVAVRGLLGKPEEAVETALRESTKVKGLKERIVRDEIMEAFGAANISLDKMDGTQKLKFVRNVLKKAGVTPGDHQMRAWDLLEKMGAKKPEDLEEIVRLNMQMIDNSDVALMDEVFAVASTKSKVSEGVRGLMRFMQKSVLAVPAGAVKDTIGSLMWYWIHARNPLKSAAKAMRLLVEPKAFAKAMSSGARVWQDAPILDAMFASRAIMGRTEVEAGRLAESVISPVGRMEQMGLIGTAAQVAGKPIEAAGWLVGKAGKAMGLGETKVGKAIGAAWGAFQKRGRAIGKATDMPIHFRKIQDEVWRVALYMDRLDAGFTPEKAVQEVFRAFGNMNELTTFEEKYLKQWFFFYTWMRKALPRAARAFLDHPIKARMVYMATVGDVGANEDGRWPEWMQQLGGWHIGRDEMGNPAVINVMPGSWFQPLRDVTQNNILSRYETEGVEGAVLGSAQSMLRNAMPLWKVPIETATGIDSFTGLPISDPRGTGQKTADRAPPILAAPWVPDSIKNFFDVRPVYDKDDPNTILYYHMDPTKRHLLFKPVPGVEAGLNQASALTLSDERKSMIHQYSRVLGMPVYSVPEARDDMRSQTLAKRAMRDLARDVDELAGHPLAMEHGRVFVDQTSPAGIELHANMSAYGQQYLDEKLSKQRTIVGQMAITMEQSKMRKLGRVLTPAELVKIRRAAENSVLPSPGEQERIRKEGELHYLRMKNPVYAFMIELSGRLQYWSMDEADRKDYSKPDIKKAATGAAGSLRRLERFARRS